MNEANGFAVFFFPQALEALGEAIKPYLQEGPAGEHVVCNEIDTSGSLVEMTMRGTAKDGQTVALELMVPTSMVRMIVSSQSDGSFGFGPRDVASAAARVLPPIGPTAAPADAPTAAVPDRGADAGVAVPAASAPSKDAGPT